MNEEILFKKQIKLKLKDGSGRTFIFGGDNKFDEVRDLTNKLIFQAKMIKAIATTEMPDEASGELGDAKVNSSIQHKVLSSLEARKTEVIERVPGFGLRDFLGNFCHKNFRERVLEALHAEAIADYQEALASGNKNRAKYIRKMIPLWLLLSMFGGLISWITGKLSYKIGPTSE